MVAGANYYRSSGELRTALLEVNWQRLRLGLGGGKKGQPGGKFLEALEVSSGRGSEVLFIEDRNPNSG
jgi:hypothetical protein